MNGLAEKSAEKLILMAAVLVDLVLMGPAVCKLVQSAELAVDTLWVAPDKAGPLADVCAKKTAGNPFFLRQFIELLHKKQLLGPNFQLGRWDWDIDRIREIDLGNMTSIFNNIVL